MSCYSLPLFEIHRGHRTFTKRKPNEPQAWARYESIWQPTYDREVLCNIIQTPTATTYRLLYSLLVTYTTLYHRQCKTPALLYHTYSDASNGQCGSLMGVSLLSHNRVPPGIHCRLRGEPHRAYSILVKPESSGPSSITPSLTTQSLRTMPLCLHNGTVLSPCTMP